jgi:lipid II isoglutaminyl synthase (glutamine-hydrolysing)
MNTSKDPAGGPDLVIVHLYPDLLMTYGDRGNVLALAKRAQWRGFSVRIAGVSRGEPLPKVADLILIGGGSDRVQVLVGEDLLARRAQLREHAAAGRVLLGVCGGYQLMGERYTAVDGEIVEGLGILDVSTLAGSGRIIGRVRARANYGDRSFPLTGFENHAGRTTLGEGAMPLAAVAKGQGNNGADGTEGAYQGSAVGTYLHGPVLPTSPGLADALLVQALSRVTRGAPLEPLNDRLEEAAGRAAESLRR